MSEIKSSSCIKFICGGVVVVYNLVAMLLISIFSPLLHLPDLGLVTKVEVMAVYTKMVLLLMGRMAMSMALLTLT